jgi:secreted trypsin-like serine protease
MHCDQIATTNIFKMKKWPTLPVLLLLSMLMPSLVKRHDVDDKDFIALAKPYTQVCHFDNGEGTLIAKQWVITAGHVGALYQKATDPKKLVVQINHKSYHIDKVILHPHFKNFDDPEGLHHDIALIKLKEPVTDAVPARVYVSKDETGKLITLVGAGDIGTGLTGAKSNDHVTRAATNRIEEVTNQWVIFRFDAPGSKNVTEFEGVSGPGDSGGPAFVKKNNVVYIIGISSNQAIEVDDNGHETQAGHYGVMERYTRVSLYQDWITATIGSKIN